MWKLIRTAASAAEDLLYPCRCPICQQISNGFCSRCAAELPFTGKSVCVTCGRPLLLPTEEYCPDCRTYTHAFDQSRSLLRYEGEVRESIHRIKYEHKKEYLDAYAKVMAERMQEKLRQWDPQVLTYVPMLPAARRKRGYNQAEELAGSFSGYTGLPCMDLLEKTEKTAEQKKMDRVERRRNLQRAFAVRPEALDERGALPFQRILLIDDIYTTGSTVDAASAVLKEHGAEKVYALTICIGQNL
ncbi:MAG: ComF family protein [Eubacteriales bacterium]|nr:ComF family protein [Eubacteriales bacterium]